MTSPDSHVMRKALPIFFEKVKNLDLKDLNRVRILEIKHYHFMLHTVDLSYFFD